MQRLLKDASAITGEKYKMGNMADIVQAINAIQKKNGITGTTEKEARGTIQGSKNMLSAAWENVLTALAAPEDLDLSGALASLTDSAKTYLNNLFPVVSKVMDGLGDFMEQVLPDVVEKLPEMIVDFVPKLIKAGGKMVEGFGKGLKKAFQKVKWPTWDDVKNNVSKAWGTVRSGFDRLGKLIFGENADGTTKWPTWDTIKDTVSEKWEGVKTGFQELGKLFFGENADGTTNWPTADEIFEKAQEIWNSVLEKAKSLVPIVFGENTAISDALTNALTFIQTFGNWVTEHWEAVTKGIAAIGAAFAAWKLVSIVASLDPIQIAISAIAALVALIATNWDLVKEKIEEFGTWFEGVKTNFSEWINTNFIEPISNFSEKVSSAWQEFKKDFVDWVIEGSSNVLTWINENLIQPVQNFIDKVQEAINKFHEFLESAGLIHQSQSIPDSEGEGLMADYYEDNRYNNGNYNQTFIPHMKEDLEEAGVDGEHVQKAVDAVLAHKNEPEWIKKFVTDLVDASTNAESLESKIDDFTKDMTGLDESATKAAESVGAVVDSINSLHSKTVTITTIMRTIGGGYADSKNKYLNNKRDELAPLNRVPKTAKGSWNVPYDDYLTRLHRGEMVLTKSQARQFRDGNGSGNLDVAGLAASIVAAVREGMAGASVNSYLDGRNVTQRVNRRNTNIQKSRRFVTA